MQLREKIVTTFQNVFPERQIYHRSGGTVTYFSVSPWQQAIVSAGIVAILGWSLFATGTFILGSNPTSVSPLDVAERERLERDVQKYVDKADLFQAQLELRTDEFQKSTLDLLQRHAVLNELLDSLKTGEKIEFSALRGDGAEFLLDATIEEADSRTSREAPLKETALDLVGNRREIAQLRLEQEKFLEEAEDLAVERSERARGILKLTSLSTSSFGVTGEGASGGPLIEMSELGLTDIKDPERRDFVLRIGQVASRLEEARRYEKLINTLPLGQPGNVPLRITSNYGMRVDPFKKRQTWHAGIDMGAFLNAPIAASGPGKVVFAGRRTGYGRVVDVDHGSGFISRYAHMRRITVKKGDEVAKGDKLGTMGSSGRSTGPHLHYEIILNGKKYDPTPFLKAGKHVY